MRDDRVLMITGSPDNREALAKVFFGNKDDGRDDHDRIVVGISPSPLDISGSRIQYNPELSSNENSHRTSESFSCSPFCLAKVVRLRGASLFAEIKEIIVFAE